MTSEFTSQITVSLLLLSLASVVALGMLTAFLVLLYVRRKPAAPSESHLPHEPRGAAAPRYRKSGREPGGCAVPFCD